MEDWIENFLKMMESTYEEWKIKNPKEIYLKPLVLPGEYLALIEHFKSTKDTK